MDHQHHHNRVSAAPAAAPRAPVGSVNVAAKAAKRREQQRRTEARKLLVQQVMTSQHITANNVRSDAPFFKAVWGQLSGRRVPPNVDEIIRAIEVAQRKQAPAPESPHVVEELGSDEDTDSGAGDEMDEDAREWLHTISIPTVTIATEVDPLEDVLRIMETQGPERAEQVARDVHHRADLALMMRETQQQKARLEHPVGDVTTASCPICMEDLPLCKTTRYCKHEYCLTCLMRACLSRAAPAPCPNPGCAHLVDPEFVNLFVRDNAISPDDLVRLKHFRSGKQLMMLSKSCIEGGPAQCGRCDAWALGPIEPNGHAYRCLNPRCASLFCGKCSQPFHGETPCKQVLAESASEFIKKTSKPCPKCGASITHWNRHGCHDIKCSGCNTSFCYCCRVPWTQHEGRCPVYCNETCGCPPCPDCNFGHPCPSCDGKCSVCLGHQ
jgi:hypothetical protein